MKSRFKKVVLPVLLVSIFLLTSLNPLAAKPIEYFTVELQADVNNASLSNRDLSNVKVDIYRSTLDRYESSVGAYIYGHEYSHSVYTNSRGSVRFIKPSDRFLVKVDITTLPSDMGIEKKTVFYNDVFQKSDSFAVSEIADFEISCDTSLANGVRVDIFNASGEAIKADYAVTPTLNVNAKSSVLASTYQISGSVTVGSIVKNYSYTVEDTNDPLEKIANALEANRISKEEALDLYLELFASGYDIGFCATPIMDQLMPFYEDTDFFNQLPPAKQDALSAMVITPMNRAGTYYTAHFAINHEGSTTPTHPKLITDIGAALEASYTKFITQLGYTPPVSSFSSSIYDVTITSATYAPNPAAAGGCASASDNTSKITFYKIPANSLGGTITPAFQTVIAHEYMHAIMNTYRWNGFMPDWYCESFASLAMITQYGTTGAQQLANDLHISSFMECSAVPFTNLYGSPAYGAVLFPLYIQMNHGGDATIKNIITSSASSSNVYTNIDSALPGSTTLASIYSSFWLGNYRPYTTYAPNSVSAWNIWPSEYQYYNYFNKFAYNDGPYVVDGLSCHFLGFALVSNSMSITVEIDYPSDSRCFLTLKTSGGVLNTVSMGSPSNFYTLVTSSSGYVEGNVMLANVGLGSAFTYEFTVYQ